MSRPAVSIVIPTYNERDNLPVLLGRLFVALENAGISGEAVIVDDGSPDGTARLANELARQYPLQVITRPGKGGLSSAVIDGWRAARGDILGVMDADLSHPPEAVPEVIRPILEKRADVSLGSRHVKGGRDEGLSPSRRIVSKGASLIARPLVPVRDPMTGLIFFKRQVIQGVDLNPTGFKIALEVLVKGRYNVIREVPYCFKKRLNGDSKLGGKEYVNYLRHAVRLYRHRFPAGVLIRPLAASFSFILANLGMLYLLVDGALLDYRFSGTIAFLGALAFLAGHLEPAPDGEIRPFLRSFAIASALAFGLNIGVLSLMVNRLGLTYIQGALIADVTMVVPLLVTAAFSGLPGVATSRAPRTDPGDGR